ncbi:hypothetical protein MYCTH_2301753 [Thermothelomyces thermophilus ATCC 42464]|uniref:BAR domain-containing protein n=1 Tax=Thermothelomyces thermophilus (strain ATCC 42464 / BCRC 31852 / DSM 1799) TaxID=573729 RepID=G2QA22_THET4|nr:uncharacterized protein MYCTH_2301753 [Thermothelomyces thermophilus ATCC 42464]AEO56626.1 hypothetical protein MYCTH_2301753 [Thermothelomyces thermophilus ATCC 42464]
MHITKKFDRAFQWAGEKMGGEAKTTMSEEFKMLETEMALRFDGMERLQRSMNQYVKWMGRHLDASEDKEKALPVGYLGRTMANHGEEFQADSEFGNCLITMGRANERLSAIQEAFVADATASWLGSLERSLAMMKEYQAARKKLENRRLNYDASIGKLQKAKRDDFRLEEELRAAKVKYEESTEDVLRRMQDIQEAEVDNTRDLTRFLDAELEYHERCAEELRRVRQNWPATSSPSYSPVEPRAAFRNRSGTTSSSTERLSRAATFDESSAPPVRMPIRPAHSRVQSSPQKVDGPVRPTIGSKPNTSGASFQGDSIISRDRGASMSSIATPSPINDVTALRGKLRPISRIFSSGNTTRDQSNNNNSNSNKNGVFADGYSDGDDTASDAGSPNWSNRSTSSAASSVGSLSRSPSEITVTGVKKAPPPPPPSRAKKPSLPVPARGGVGY